MNILNITITDSGGAGIASRNFHNLFLKMGLNSLLLVKLSSTKTDSFIVLNRKPKKTILRHYIDVLKYYYNQIHQHFYLGPLDPKYCFFNYDDSRKYVNINTILNRLPFKPDFILLHWISGFITSRDIREMELLTKAKVIWLMMDNAPITGGCHYPWECTKYQIDCSDCPAIINTKKKHKSVSNLVLKDKNLPESLEVIAFSESDYNRAKKSKLMRSKKVHRTFSPIDENTFVPYDKYLAKKVLGIQSQKKVIFCGSFVLNDFRKGGQFLLEVLEILQKQENIDMMHVLIILAGENSERDFKTGIQVLSTGLLEEKDLINVYQAADLFLNTSLEDSGPTMINQSLMCGTPVVAFKTGVVPDLVIDGKTGYTAGVRNSKELASGILEILRMDESGYKQMSSNCRTKALETCSTIKVAEAFKEILGLTDE